MKEDTGAETLRSTRALRALSNGAVHGKTTIEVHSQIRGTRGANPLNLDFSV